MTKILKKVFSLVLLLALLLELTACHGRYKEREENESPSDYSEALTEYELPESFDSSKNYEITFWAKSDSNVNQTNIYRRAIEEFEALYPNIKVKLTVEMDYGRLYQNVITNIATGTTPNVAISYPDHVATYLTGNKIVVPLDSLLTDDKFGLGGSEVRFDAPSRDELIDKFLEEGKIGGKYYTLPFMRSSEACYVNVDLLSALGYELPEVLTWDFIFEVSEAAMAKNPDGTYVLNGQNVLIPFIYKSTDNMMIQMLKQSEAGYSNDEGDVLIFNDTTREILEKISSVAESGAFSTFKIVSYPGNFFNRGQCIFAVDSTAGATWMGSNAPLIDIPKEELAEFETAVLPVPQVNNDNPVMISQGPSMCLFNKQDEGEVLASWLFMQYLLTNGIQIAYSETEGYVPVTEKAQKSAEYQSYLAKRGEEGELYYDVKIDATRLLLENTENTFVTPVFNGSANLRNAAGQMIEEVVKSARRGERVDGLYIDALFREMTTLYRLDREISGMPIGSVLLIAGIATVDAALVGYLIYQKIKDRARKKSKSRVVG